MTHNNFRAFLASFLCITLIPFTPLAGADSGADALTNDASGVGDINFTGGAFSSRTTGFGNSSTRIKPYNPNDKVAINSNKAIAVSPYDWMNIGALTSAKSKKDDEKIAEDSVRIAPTFTPVNARTALQNLKSFEIDIPSIVEKVREQSNPGFDLEEDLAFSLDVESFDETENEELDDVKVLFPDIEVIEEEKLQEEYFDSFKENKSDLDSDKVEILPLVTEDNVMESLVLSGSIPQNFDELLATKFSAESMPTETEAVSLALEENLENTEGGEDGYWKEIEVIDPAVLAQIAALQIQLALLNAERDSLNNELSSLNADIAALDNQISSLDERIANLQELIDQLNEQLDRIQANIDELQTQIDDKQREYDFLEFQWNALRDRNIALDQMARALWAELYGIPRPSRERRSQILRERAALRDEFNANRRQMNRLRDEGLRIARTIRRLEERKARMEQAKARIQERLNRIQNTMDRLQEERNELLEQRRQKEERRNEIIDRLNEIARRAQEIQDQINELMKNLYKKIWIWVPGSGGHSTDPETPEEPEIVDHSPDTYLLVEEKEAQIA